MAETHHARLAIRRKPPGSWCVYRGAELYMACESFERAVAIVRFLLQGAAPLLCVRCWGCEKHCVCTRWRGRLPFRQRARTPEEACWSCRAQALSRRYSKGA